MSTSLAGSFSDQEKTYIQALLLQTTDKLRDVEQQIARLTCQQAELQSDISNYKVALAPYKMLPEHSFQLIFRWCIPPSGFRISRARDGEPRPSFIQVCSSWRKLAMNTPELWRDVTLELYDDCYNGCRIDLAHKWLSCAGDMPKSLRMTQQYPDDPKIRWPSEAVDRLVVPFRFRSLDLILSRSQFQRVLSLPLQTQCLDSLRLMVARLLAFPRAADEDCSACNLITTLPWSQLRYLRINDARISASTLINVLS